MARRPNRRKRADGPAEHFEAAKGTLRHKPDARIDNAQRAWDEGRFDEATWLYERALERQPTNAVLLADVARAYALRFRYAEAEQLIDRACRIHPDDANLQRMLGRSFVQLQQFDRAIACFRRSLELEPTSPERAHTLYELSQMHERLHQLEDARACAEQSLALAPHQPVLQYLLGVIDRRAGDVASAQARLTMLTGSRLAPPVTLSDAWYQLAAIYDKQGRFEDAYRAARQAKEILTRIASRHRYDADDIAAVSRTTHRTITAGQFDCWHAAAEAFRPFSGGLALLTSHPRSGTTLLEQVLDSHPGLISADEISTMADVVYLPCCKRWPKGTPVPEILDAAQPEEIERFRHAYWSAMQGALREEIGSRILLDKNPVLTALLPLVARMFTEMKIVFALRDPRDVVVSCFMQQLPLNAVSVQYLSLEETAQTYAATMRNWLKLREMIHNPWLEVRYEETVTDMENQARRVLDFLGLPWDENVLQYHRRAQQKHVHSPTYEAVTKPVYTTSIGRWKHYATHLQPCIEILQPYIEAFGYSG